MIRLLCRLLRFGLVVGLVLAAAVGVRRLQDPPGPPQQILVLGGDLRREQVGAGLAAYSHLPVLVSAALLLAADQGGALGPDGFAALLRLLASSGFADTTRVGGGNPALGTLMAENNRDSLLQALALYRRQLEQLTAAVEQHDWSGLKQDLDRSAALRPDFL